MIIDSLLVALGFDVDKKGIAEFEQRVQEARNTVMTVVTAAGVAAAAVGAFVYSVASKTDELGDFADLNQVTVASLEELGYAAELNGSSLDAVKSSVQGLNSVMGQVLNGVGRGAKMFEKFGFQVKNADGTVKTFDQMLGEVADRMGSMDRKSAMAMAEKLGIDASLVPLLQKGRGALEKLRAEAQAFGVTSEENVQASSNLMDALAGVKFLVQALTNAIAFGVMPRVTALIERFKAWYMANREVIQQRLETVLALITGALGLLWDIAYKVVTKVIDLAESLAKFESATWLAVAAVTALVALKVGQAFQTLNILLVGATAKMMAFNFAALLIPMAIGAVILALGLLIDDFLTFQRGGESIIGDLVNKWPNALHLVRGLLIALGVAFGVLAVKGAVSLAALVVSTVAAAATQVAAWLSVAAATLAATWPILLIIAIIAAVGVAIWALYDNWDAVVTFFKKAADFVGDAIKNAFNGAIDWVIGLFDKAWEKVSAFFDFVSNGVKKVAGAVGIDLGDSSASGADSGGVATPSGASGTALNLASPPVLEMISQSPAMTGVQQPATYGPSVKSGPLGNAASMSKVDNSMNNSGNTTVAKIEIVSPNPEKAGEAVKRELSRANKTGIRNGQVGYN